MKTYTVKRTYENPEVNLDPDTGILFFKGRSIPPYADEFYDPILEWITEYSKNPQKQTIVKLQIEYYNTISQKYILDILKLLEDLYKKGCKVKIHWQFIEEIAEDVKEEGEEFEKIVSLPFEYIMVNE